MKQKLHQKSWGNLTPRQKLLRERSLEVLSLSRKSNKSLSKISKEKQIPIVTVLNHTNGFKKINGRWNAKKFDRISRIMKINESGKEVSIDIRDSRTASKIGRYHQTIGILLETGESNRLKQFENIFIKDSNGKIHIFETSIEHIIAINERKESFDSIEIYGD